MHGMNIGFGRLHRCGYYEVAGAPFEVASDPCDKPDCPIDSQVVRLVQTGTRGRPPTSSAAQVHRPDELVTFSCTGVDLVLGRFVLLSMVLDNE